MNSIEKAIKINTLRHLRIMWTDVWLLPCRCCPSNDAKSRLGFYSVTVYATNSVIAPNRPFSSFEGQHRICRYMSRYMCISSYISSIVSHDSWASPPACPTHPLSVWLNLRDSQQWHLLLAVLWLHSSPIPHIGIQISLLQHKHDNLRFHSRKVAFMKLKCDQNTT